MARRSCLFATVFAALFQCRSGGEGQADPAIVTYFLTIKFILNETNSSPLTNEFVIGSKTVADKTVIAQAFNEYFVNIGPTLANDIPDSNVDYMSFLKGNYKDSFALFETDILEVTSVTENLKSKTSSGYDNIPTDIIKLSINCTAPHLVKIINKLQKCPQS